MATAATTTAAARPETLHRCPTCKGSGVDMDSDEVQLCACNVDEATRRTHAFRMFNLIPVGRGTLGRLSDRAFRRLSPERRAGLVDSMQRMAQFFGFEDIEAVLTVPRSSRPNDVVHGVREMAAISWREIYDQLRGTDAPSASTGSKAA